MLTQDELRSYKLLQKFDNVNFTKRFNLSSLFDKKAEEKELTTFGQAEFNIQILSRNLDAANPD